MLIAKQTSVTWLIAVVTLLLIPVIYVLYLISQAGEIPNFDYWWIVSRFYSTEGFSSDLRDWFFRNNEHIVLIPSLVYALNIVLTQGSNLGLCLFAFSFAAIQAILLVALLPQQVQQSVSLLVLVLFCVLVFNFTPAAAHNWMRGFSGTIWMGANLFVIAAIFCITRAVERLSVKPDRQYSYHAVSLPLGWVVGSFIFALFGTLNYSTALAVWPILCAIALLFRFPRLLSGLYLGVSTLVLLLYFLTYETPPHHPELARLSFGEMLVYIPIYLGAIFTYQLQFAAFLGIVGLVASAIFAYYWFCLPRSHAFKIAWLPWLAIQTYTFGTALMAAVSRSGFGLGQARSSRYASLPALFWLGLLVILIAFLVQQFSGRLQGRSLLPLYIALGFLIWGMYGVGDENYQEISRRASLQPLVALSLQIGAPDPTLVQEVVGNRPEAFLGLAEALKRNQLVPFTREIAQDNPCIPLDRALDPNFLTAEPQSDVPGYFDGIALRTDVAGDRAIAQVTGWAKSANHGIRCIAILNQNNMVRGFALTGFPRPDVAEAMGEDYQWSGWKGYIRSSPEDRQLTAYAALKNRQSWVALQNPHPFPK
ncbi:MAG: hypothetical protein F6K32_06760 [Desertifilum sp. SIO1I2]|nr:hypothetical protein [Desertifilum sp. SIO1I2]